MRILYLVHRIPYPPNKGDKIRSYHILRYLASKHEVFLGGFYDDPEDREHVDALSEFVAEFRFEYLDRRRLARAGMRALVHGRPVTLEMFDDARLHEWVAGLQARVPLDACLVFSSSMGQYLPGGSGERLRTVVDLVDVDSEKWREYAHKSHVLLPMRFIYRREARLLQRFELDLAARADATLLVSEQERELFLSLAERAGLEVRERVFSMRNGVDTEFFDPQRSWPRPHDGKGVHLVFTGAMDYWANVDGVEWFVREILPRIAEHRPDVRFHIVGSNPDPRVRELAGEHVNVTGRVEDVRPYLAHARLAVCPLRIARGIQNKVLEAMAMGLPVVATPEALTGIDCSVLSEFGTSRPDVFAENVIRLLDDADLHREISATVRAHVERHFSWEASLGLLDELMAS